MNDNWFKKYGWLIPLCLLLLVTAFMVLMASNQAKMNRTLQEFVDSGIPYVADRGNFRVVNLASSALSVTAAISFDEAPADEVPVDESPEGDVPADEVPVDESPEGDVPADEVPVDESPEGEVPADEVPVDESPEGEAPAGEVPEGEAPADGVRVDESPEGEAPKGEVSGREYADYIPETMTDEILLEIRDILNTLLHVVLLVIAAKLVYMVFFSFRYLWRY